MTSYAFRDGSKTKHGLTADNVGEALADIEADQGALTAQGVVDASEPEQAPLHECFEWRNDVAANEYRKHQSRDLIKWVEVWYDKDPAPTPLYYNVRELEYEKPKDPGVYVTAASLKDNPEHFELVWRDAQKRLNQAQKAIQELNQIGGNLKDPGFAIRVQAVQEAHSKVVEAAQLLAS